MRIVHLSDTHVGRGNNSARMHALVQHLLAQGTAQDHLLVHTGDLNDRSTPENMRQGLEALAPLRRAGWQVLLAPGNHDYGDALRISPQAAKTFGAAYGHYLYGHHVSPQAARFPVLTLLDDCALIGLDSNQGELSWWQGLFAEGSLGNQQLAALSALLDAPDVRQRTKIVYLHHHPFLDSFAVRPDVGERGYLAHLLGWNTRRFRRLKDAYSLMQCIRDRVDILLFGHQHYGLDYSAEGQRYGIPLALDASSSTATQMDTDRMRYRVIDTTTLRYTTHMVALP